MTVLKLTTETDRTAALAFLAKLSLRARPGYELELRQSGRKRSPEQNRRYWRILTTIAENLWVGRERYLKESWHEFFKGEFIGWEELALPGGGATHTAISSTKLNVGQFGDYMTAIEAFAVAAGVEFDHEDAAAFEQYRAEAAAWRESEKAVMEAKASAKSTGRRKGAKAAA